MNIGIIGIGLIGSSLALAFRDKAPDAHILIADINEDHIAIAKSRDLGHHYDNNPGHLAKTADIIFICTPVSAIAGVVKEISEYLKPEAIITDVGSVKSQVIDTVRADIPERAVFIPGHPIAGTENSGPAAGFSELFQNKSYILTPLDTTDEHYLEKIENLLRRIGAVPSRMDADEHDQIMGFASHMVHIFAFSGMLESERINNTLKHDLFDYAKGSFQDFTRVAASDVTMWRDIFMNNGEHVVKIARDVVKQAEAFIQAIEQRDENRLVDMIAKARALKLAQLEKDKTKT